MFAHAISPQQAIELWLAVPLSVTVHLGVEGLDPAFDVVGLFALNITLADFFEL